MTSRRTVSMTVSKKGWVKNKRNTVVLGMMAWLSLFSGMSSALLAQENGDRLLLPKNATVPEATADSSLMPRRNALALSPSLNDTILVPSKAERMDPLSVMLWTLAVPGFGQIYNESYWKLPIVYGALGALLYLGIENHQLYLDYRERYLNDISSTPPSPLAQSNRRLRDFYRTNRDQNYLFFVGAYLLMLFDAYIDAHFFDFETSDQLALRLSPYEYGAQPAAFRPPGQTVALRFHWRF